MTSVHYDVDDFACCSDDESSCSDYSPSAVDSMTSLDTDTAVLDDARVSRVPPLPTSVKINVEGAFIVDEEESESHSSEVNGHAANDHVHWDKKDIVLPHHTDVVSHVAVDVSTVLMLCLRIY